MIKQFYSRKGAPFKKEHVQDIGSFIDNIPKKTTRNILEEIRKSPNHVIHDYITWDNKAAADKCRLQETRNIVNHVEVRIIDDGSSEQVRAFYPVVRYEESDDEELTGGPYTYVSVEEAFDDVENRRQVIGRAKAELKNWRDRYKVYKELKDIMKVIEPFIEE
jgi:hypothetical protein